MKLYSFLLLALFSHLVLSFTGDGTVYTKGFVPPDGARGYNCGFRWLPTKARTYFAALNAPQYLNAANCGRCATVKCADSKCKSQASVTVMIVDQCPECLSGSLDFSQEAWDVLTGISPNRVKISWNFVPCDSMVDPVPAKLAIKEGSNRWWFALQVSNVVNPIVSVRVFNANSWITLQLQSYGFWVGTCGQGLSLPVTVEAKDSTGKTYSKVLSNIDGDQVLDF